MKIACLQLKPVITQVDRNIEQADKILAESPSLEGLDLLVLPELAFTGYCFPSAEAIKPYLEQTAAGISTDWAKKTAVRLGCHVIVGYPELSSDFNRYGQAVAYNSTVSVDPTGAVVATYRKSHLYYTDEIWAAEGSGFFCGELGSLGVVNHGICMDINPYRFETPWEAYEFANHGIKGDAALVVLSTAWLTHTSKEELDAFPHDPDMETISYWYSRFQPLTKLTDGKPVTIVFANRAGSEQNSNRNIFTAKGQIIDLGPVVSYAGSSCVMQIQGEQARIFDMLGANEEKLLIVDTEKPPLHNTSQKLQLDITTAADFDRMLEAHLEETLRGVQAESNTMLDHV